METKKKEIYQIKNNNLEAKVEFDHEDGVLIKIRHQSGVVDTILLTDNVDESISELYDIFREIYRINTRE